jgi:hypothetical protein
MWVSIPACRAVFDTPSRNDERTAAFQRLQHRQLKVNLNRRIGLMRNCTQDDHLVKLILDLPMVDKERETDEFRYVVERVEEKDVISSNDEDVAALKNILERKIADLQTEINSPIDKNG